MATNTPTPVAPAMTNAGARGGVPRELAVVRALVRVLDNAFTVPGTRFRIGLDPILGLLPGIGDVVGAAIGSYILIAAARLGAPRAVIGRMLMNIGTDAVAGAVPVVGDVLDAAWRANLRNARLLEEAVARPRETRRTSTWMLAGIVAAVFGVAVAGIALAIVLATWVARLITG